MNVKTYVRALLCLYLTLIISSNTLKAQALKVGDRLPPELWSLPLQVINHPAGKETITLSEYKDKLIILDFWATWCGPCIAMLPKQDSLQNAFSDKLKIVPVTYQKAAEVNTFMEKYEKRKGKKSSFTIVTGDNALRGAFPHTYLPHYVWIDASGVVKAITESKEVSADNIKKIIKSELTDFRMKEDAPRIPYDRDSPLLINGNGGTGENLLFHSLLTSYTQGLLPAGYNVIRDSINSRVVARNIPVTSLLRLAYSEKGYLGRNRLVLNVKEPEKLTTELSGADYENWKRDSNAFCYEIIIPASEDHKLHNLMQDDLKKYFTQYKFGLEKKEVMCLVLKLLPNTTLKPSSGGKGSVDQFYGGLKLTNRKLAVLVGYLNILSLQHSPHPVIDGTGYTQSVDLLLEANLSDINELNAALHPYGLVIEKELREIDMLTVSDNHK